MTRPCRSLAIALLIAALGYAQQGSNGSISGTVVDPSDAQAPSAAVKVSELNGEEKATVSNGQATSPVARVPMWSVWRLPVRPLESRQHSGGGRAARARQGAVGSRQRAESVW